MSYVPDESGEGHKILAILALAFGIAGLTGSVLLIVTFWVGYLSSYVGYASFFILDVCPFIYIAIGGVPFAIAGFVMGIVAKGSFSKNSETKQMAVTGMVGGITFFAHAAAAFGIWLLNKLS
ncbi:MAG: hypothetical protein IH991_14170 [Planctomycetes bacterium]|nr:hypothetical protein [Planctomycetota bacterium]